MKWDKLKQCWVPVPGTPPAIVAQIVALRKRGFLHKEIVDATGISQPAVSRLLTKAGL